MRKRNKTTTAASAPQNNQRREERSHTCNFGITKAASISMAIGTIVSTAVLNHRTKRNSPLVLANMCERLCVCVSVWELVSVSVDVCVNAYVNGRPNNRSDYNMQLMNRNSLWRFFMVSSDQLFENMIVFRIHRLTTLSILLIVSFLAAAAATSVVATFLNASNGKETHLPFVAIFIWWIQCEWKTHWKQWYQPYTSPVHYKHMRNILAN